MSDLDIKNIRKKLDISQSNLAKNIGVSIRTIQNWESGEIIPKTKHELLRNLLNNQIQQIKLKNTIPLIPIDAMAGFGVGEMQIMDYDGDQFVVPTFKGAEFLIQVKGSSMHPKYSSGDIVACKKLAINDIFFQWNKVYVIDTEQGALIKRLKEGKDEEHVLIVSENDKYSPFNLHKSKINAISIVMGVIRLE